MATKVFVTCPRCSGSGFIKAFSHVKGGLCFKCKGPGDVGFDVRFQAFGPQAGTVKFLVRDFLNMGRRGRIAQAAKLIEDLKLHPIGSNGLVLVELALILALGEPDVRARGVAAVAGCRLVDEDRAAFANLLRDMMARWGRVPVAA